MVKRKLKLKELFTGRRVFIVRLGTIIPATVLQNAHWVIRRKESMYHSLIDFGPAAVRDPHRGMVGRCMGESEHRHRVVFYHTREQMVTLKECTGNVIRVGEDDSGIEENIFSTLAAAQRWINKRSRACGRKINLIWGSLTSTLIRTNVLIEAAEDAIYPISNIDYDPAAILGESEPVVIEGLELRDDFQDDRYGLIDILNGDKPTPSISDSLRKLNIKKD